MRSKLVTIVFGAMLAVAPTARALDGADANTVDASVAIQTSHARELVVPTHPLVTFGASLLLGAVAIVASQARYE